MKKILENKNEKAKETIAISQILILLVGIFAFVYFIGSIPGVSANGDPEPPVPPEIIIPSVLPYGIEYLGDFIIPSTAKELGATVAGVSGGASQAGAPVTGLDFLGGFGNLGGAIVNGAGAIGAAYAGNRLGSLVSDLIGANGPWTIAVEGLGTAAGAFAFLVFIASVNPIIAGILAGVGLIVSIFFTETIEEVGAVVFYCNAWDAQTGGQYCELCNEQEVPCSEYQCKSLGQSCGFEPSSEERDGDPWCFWDNQNDFDPPIIKPNTNVLTIGYFYEPPNSVSFPDRDTSVKIINPDDNEGCLSPYTNVTFGVTLNKLAKCKVSFERRNTYGEMSTFFGKAGRDINHTMTFYVPEIDTSVGQDNQISAYVRCQSVNGYPEEDSPSPNFVFQMCVQEGPDINPPIIYGTSIEDGSKVSFNVTSAPVDFYTNEPANCKWSFSPGRSYLNMENNMSCSTDPAQINLQLSYTCSANLTGIRQNEETFYYVKCQDLSERKNTNVQDYVYSLSASRALAITSASPNDTIIRDSTSPARVTLEARTVGGAYDGSALCYWSTTGDYGDYTIFDETSSNEHSTDVYLYSGDHDFFIKCDDLAGNADVEEINFGVEIDSFAPLISRAYYEDGFMKIITNEEAECVFSTDSCTYQFEEGVNIQSTDQTLLNHRVGWQTESDLYIKCQDIYANQPASADECSIIVRAHSN